MKRNISRYILITLIAFVMSAGIPLSPLASTGRNGNYSQFSAHGGFGTNTRGVLRTETDNDGYAAGNCAHCHEQHASIASSNGTPNDHLLFDTLIGNALCYTCHDGSKTNGKDIYSQIFFKSYGHDPLVDQGGGTTSLPLCSKCHNSHEARIGSHSEAYDGNLVFTTGPLVVNSGPLFSVAEDPVLGTPVLSWGGTTNPAAGTEGFSSISYDTESIVIEEWQLCLKCHSNDRLPDSPGLDIADQINPNNQAVHPVVTKTINNWNNAFLSNPGNIPNAFTAGSGWDVPANVNKNMFCSDCHGAENADTAGNPQGPHGSNNEFLLKKIGAGGTGAGVDGSKILDDLCTRCHRPLNASGFVNTSAWNSGLNGNHTLPQHQYPLNPDGCMACHGGIANTTTGNKSDIHGANYTWPDPGGIYAPVGAEKFISPGGNRGTGPLIVSHYTEMANPTRRYCGTVSGPSGANCHNGTAGGAYRYK